MSLPYPSNLALEMQAIHKDFPEAAIVTSGPCPWE
jgi:hypothetical protein